jgi:hypothetical protein
LGAVLTACLVVPAIASAQDPTTTVVSCTPNSTLVGVGTSCSATVLDSVEGGGSPQGSIEFSSDTASAGWEDPGSSCTLEHAGEGGGSCRVTYVPGTVGTGVHKISASYAGSADHEASSGSANVNVAAHPSATSISCAPDSITLGSGTSTCVVTVTDTSSAVTAPTGSVALSSGSGSFGSGCEGLVLVSTSQSNCTVTYTPTGPGMNLLTGAYNGDTSHAASAGTMLVNVAPSTRGTKKKCKAKKKKKHSASTAKKKCKKKKKRR